MQINFVGGSDSGRSLNINASKSINFYPEIATQDSKSVTALIGTPGTKTFINFPVGPHRMAHEVNGRLFVISLNTLYEVYPNTSYAAIASLPYSEGRISVADNGMANNGVGGNQLLIVVGGLGYIYNLLTGSFAQITNPVFPPNAKACTYIDGYFIISNDSMNFWVSELYDGMTYSGLAFASAISTPDTIKGLLSISNQLIIIKEYSSEIWYNAGIPTSQGCPFSRVSGGMKDFGTSAPFSVARSNNVAFFLANTRSNLTGNLAGVAMSTGSDIQIISTLAINYRLSHLSTISDAWGYCYTDEGHSFYVLTFPTEDITLVYDVGAQMWHERSSVNNSTDDLYSIHRHLANSYVYFNNKHLIGSYLDGRLLEMSSKYYDDDGKPIISVRTSQAIFDKNELDHVKISKLIIDVEGGVGDGSTTPHNNNPQAWLSWSNDGGHTWSADYSGSIGEQGNYSTRLAWRRLGAPRNRIFRLKMIDSVKKVILGAYINNGSLPS